MLKLGVLISGRGSNLQALIDAAQQPDYPAKIALVIANRPDAAGLQRAAAAGIATQIVDHKNYHDRESFEAVLDATLRAADVQLVCLAGFMRVLTAWFVSKWEGRLINIHPSLLPEFPGVDTHRRALAAGAKQTGCTVHYVVPQVDTGPIIVQAQVPVLLDDDEDKLAARVLVAEHKAYPLAVRLIATGKAQLQGDRVVVTDPVAQAEINALG